LWVSAHAFEPLSVIDWARRSARSGSVAVSAPTTAASAVAFEPLSVIDWATCSAQSGSVAASAPTTAASADALLSTPTGSVIDRATKTSGMLASEITNRSSPPWVVGGRTGKGLLIGV